ncbi:MAG: hypothetical protein N4A41_14500 [Crocinitomicaceae bacterium]|jgi:hypothetical protein|nr:hypothetical protein [Crocinitomicaceae bacterium]
MIGNKLYQLTNELSLSQRKAIFHQCTISSDKRLGILKALILSNPDSLEKMNATLVLLVNETWEDSSDAEKELKVRRLASFFVDQIEKYLLSAYMEKNSSIKNILLAQMLEKGGNLTLLNNYYDKAYALSLQEQDQFYRMISLKGKLRMSYASQNEKELNKALELNEELLRIIQHTNSDRVTEYYYNMSNIYLEKNSLIRDRKEELEKEINEYLESYTYPLNRASLYVSLAKLNYDNEKLQVYFSKAKEILNANKEDKLAYDDLNRKIRFLELRLKFFAGTDNKTLLSMAEQISEYSKGFSIINNNTLFYRILFMILDGEIDKAAALLEENHVFFKGEGKLLERFLLSVIMERRGEYKEAIQALQKTMYSTNYFIVIFSRLMFIKVQILRNKSANVKPLIDSSLRYIVQNSGNPLGQEAHQYTLKKMKQHISSKQINIRGEKPTLTVFHEYLLDF